MDKATENSVLAQESFRRSLSFTKAWLEKADPESGLIPSNLNAKVDVWDPANAAADNYPFMVLTAYLLDKDLYNGVLLDILNQEKKMTSRLGVLPDVYSFSKKDFNEYPVNMGNVIFGASEYIKDGLIPLNELIGESPWQNRMMEILDELSYYTEDFNDLEKFFTKASSVEEINGEMLQILSRVFWMTADDKYLNWAISIADHYLLEKDLSQMEYLRLRDHGCEIIGGLSELYLSLRQRDHPKADLYRQPLHALLDKILFYGRNEDGLFYNAINLKDLEVVDDRIADTWGYILNAYYTVWLVDQKEAYHQAVLKPFNALYSKYRNYNWEPRKDLSPLGSHDGYADAIESGINLYNREKDSNLERWIDSEIEVMMGMQQANGIIEGWHGDGNFARTALMYALWKTQGARVSPWNENIRIGASSIQGETYFVISSKKEWKGKLIFDPIRHETILHLPIDYPRINQFPEWFTVDPNLNYKISSSHKSITGNFSGNELIQGIPLRLRGGEMVKILVE
ncbi:MAG: hypothetical protein CMC93_02930 [Flavobacteriaceae bacterium]|nr:hypothetical protein [Flavobacteriaceae bacterium]